MPSMSMSVAGDRKACSRKEGAYPFCLGEFDTYIHCCWVLAGACGRYRFGPDDTP